MTAIIRPGAVEAALASLFPQRVACAAELFCPGQDDALWPAERSGIAGAVPLRRAEFAAGRAAARRCLVDLGLAPCAIPVAPDRAAIWPAGIFGSISHAAGLAIAVATEAGPLGVDVEPDAPLDAELWPIICCEDELSRLPKAGRGRWVKQIFAAKEAVFKAQAPAQRTMFGFDSVAVHLEGNAFVAQFQVDVGAFIKGQQVQGKLMVVQGMVLAGVAR